MKKVNEQQLGEVINSTVIEQLLLRKFTVRLDKASNVIASRYNLDTHITVKIFPTVAVITKKDQIPEQVKITELISLIQ